MRINRQSASATQSADPAIDSGIDIDTVAIAALATIAADPQMLNRFLALTGHQGGDIRKAAQEPEFLAGVLHFTAEHEPVLLAAAASLGLTPDAVRILLQNAKPHPRQQFD
ncbi:MAG: DUF3572 family protein [Alphaproteobacteria bacterium]